MDQKEFPNWWQCTTLGDITDKLVDGSHNPPAKQLDGLPMLSAVNIADNKIHFSAYRLITEEAFEKEDARTRIQTGDVLLTIVGAIGRTAVVPENTRPFTLQRSVAVLKPVKVDSKFLMYQLASPRVARFFNKNARGTAQKGVYLKTLASTEIWISPVNEQHRIVAKIETLFSELDKGIESLKTAREQLKIYRQAVLKNAFEGKFTAHWREQNRDKLETPEHLLACIQKERQARYQKQLQNWQAAVKAWEENGKEGKKPGKPNILPTASFLENEELDGLPSLPPSWCWLKIGNLCDVVRGGSPRPAGDARYYDGDIPFLKVADLTRTNGCYLNSHTYTIKPAGLQKTRFIGPNTLLISNSGATLGVPKICLIDATFNDGIAAFLGLSSGELLYHYYFWSSKTAELRSINQGAAQPNLNTNLIKEIAIPVCSYEEMTTVAKEIEKLLSVNDHFLGEINEVLSKSETLRQSILKKAFSGQLVPQDPNDEPANALLARIQEENATHAVNASKTTNKNTGKTLKQGSLR